jgi:hypothetical protein
MRSLISAGAIALACATVATPAQATYFVSGKHPTTISFGKPGSAYDAWFGGKTIVKWPVVIVPSKPATGGSLAEIIDKLLNPAPGNDKDVIKQIVETIFKHVHGRDNNHTPDCAPGNGHGSQPEQSGGNTGGGATPGTGNDTPDDGGTTPGTGDGSTAPGGSDGGVPEQEVPIDAGPVGSVPEPASWMTMIVGFGAVGGAMRACRRTLKLA